MVGLMIAGLGLVFILVGKIPFSGRLPGDFYFKKGNFQFYFPLTTSIIISIVLSLVSFLFYLLRGRN